MTPQQPKLCVYVQIGQRMMGSNMGIRSRQAGQPNSNFDSEMPKGSGLSPTLRCVLVVVGPVPLCAPCDCVRTWGYSTPFVAIDFSFFSSEFHFLPCSCTFGTLIIRSSENSSIIPFLEASNRCFLTCVHQARCEVTFEVQ